MSLYVFAIGGSGSRVLRSLTMLLASGVKAKRDIIPIIIDPDVANGDMVRTVELLRNYEKIRSKISAKTDQCDFFSTQMNSLNGDEGYLLQLEGTSGINFDKYLKISGMSEENAALTKMLFSYANLSSNMDVGFKGNPNIGSIVLNQLSESQVYQAFINNFSSNDKIFIISSIFGGTGASGFPLLVKSLRNSDNTAVQSAAIGAVTLLPYFNLQTNENSAIQADSFITKTKSALNYYEKNIGNGSVDDMYYLGDDYSNVSYDNCEGGDDQQNKAHIIEMLAALSIIDFDKRNHEGNEHRTAYHEFGLVNDIDSSVSLTDFGSDTKKILAKPLSMLAIMNRYFKENNKDHIFSQKWGIELGKNFMDSELFKDFYRFMGKYDDWLQELKENKLSFNPFNTDSVDQLDMVDGYSVTYKSRFLGIGKKAGFDFLNERLSENINQKAFDDSLGDARFVALFSKTLNDIIKENLKMEGE